MEEDIKILQEYTKHDTDLVNLPEYDAKIVYRALENLISRNKELEKIVDTLNYGIKNHFIPKSKIKEEI